MFVRCSFMRSPILVISTLILLSGCTNQQNITLNGVVQDDYIQGATVCVDLNANGACDSGEPSTVSDNTGSYSLSTSQDGPIVVQVGTNAINLTTGLNITSAYTMAAPAGNGGVVNPLTTLVHAKMLADGVDAQTAQTQVIALLGLSVTNILSYDYQKNNDAATLAIARSVATQLTALQPHIQGSMTQGVANKSLIALIQAIGHAAAAGQVATAATVTKGDIYAVNTGDASNPRGAAGHPGDVEVIAGTGYNHTLLDSADNKCQHCHNDLYDTWKKSMHSQSWSDQVFQSQYQDYLRMSLSKIGSTGSTGTLYTEAKFKGAAQVCIKCHAPGAYYSGDFDVQLEVLSTVPATDYTAMKATKEYNLSPAFDFNKLAKVVSLSSDGKVYRASYHIGNKHNREGINCAFCHGVETVRLMNATGNDNGQYKLGANLTAGPIGPLVRSAGDILMFNASASNADMNTFFMLVGPEKYTDPGNTPKLSGTFDIGKAADGRYTMKSIPVGSYTGGPYYGPFGVTGLDNSRADDTLNRHALVNQTFVNAGRLQHMEDYGKGFCLSCHQRSAGALNPESNGVAGVQATAGVDPADQFMELCTTWSAVSNSATNNNYTDTPDSPKCQRCHMERVDNKVVLHKWNDPKTKFTSADGITNLNFLPDSGIGPVALGYLNNHAFMGANAKDFGTGKIKSGFGASMNANLLVGVVTVNTSLQNKTAHMFPGAHPMRRVLTRVVATDANGVRLNYTGATGNSTFADVTNATIATLPGETIPAGRDTVSVTYDATRTINIFGMSPDLAGGAVVSQQFDASTVSWEGSFGSVTNPQPIEASPGVWGVRGTVGVNKIIDSAELSHFTRIYGRETGKKDPANAATFVVRPGFDSNIARDNRLLPNESEAYSVSFNAAGAALPISVTYKVYYMAKGASGKFPVNPDGFLNTQVAADNKMAIYEVYSQTATVQ